MRAGSVPLIQCAPDVELAVCAGTEHPPSDDSSGEASEPDGDDLAESDDDESAEMEEASEDEEEEDGDEVDGRARARHPTESLDEVDLAAVTDLVRSFEAQHGDAGPMSSMLSELGLTLPMTATSTTMATKKEKKKR